MKAKILNSKEKGITLVALVVTIVIMLILAGMALRLALGENGILKISQKAADEYKQKAKEEQGTLSELEKELGNLTTNNPGENTTITPPTTPPTGGIGSSEVATDLKKYQGKYVDIGLNTNGNDVTTTDGSGYNVKYDKTSDYGLKVNGTTSTPITGDQLTALGTTYKTFFPHTRSYDDCVGYWLASPSADDDRFLLDIHYTGAVACANYTAGLGVRPIVCLQSGVQLTETSKGSNIYNVSLTSGQN